MIVIGRTTSEELHAQSEVGRTDELQNYTPHTIVCGTKNNLNDAILVKC